MFDGSSGIANSLLSINPAAADVILDKPALIHVGTGGTIKVDTKKSTGVTLTVPDGYILRALVTKVYMTGTSATNLVAMWHEV